MFRRRVRADLSEEVRATLAYVTTGTVLLVDMSDVASAYRILSFLGVGLLLIVSRHRGTMAVSR